MVIKEYNEDTITINDVDLADLEKFIVKKLDENSLWIDDIAVYEEEDDIHIDITINWGDWKHEHRRLDFIMYDIIYEYNPKLTKDLYKVNEIITEEDGSDTYSSIHYYEIELHKFDIEFE